MLAMMPDESLKFPGIPPDDGAAIINQVARMPNGQGNPKFRSPKGARQQSEGQMGEAHAALDRTSACLTRSRAL